MYQKQQTLYQDLEHLAVVRGNHYQTGKCCRTPDSPKQNDEKKKNKKQVNRNPLESGRISRLHVITKNISYISNKKQF